MIPCAAGTSSTFFSDLQKAQEYRRAHSIDIGVDESVLTVLYGRWHGMQMVRSLLESLSMCRMQSSCRPRLRIKCAAEVKTSDTKQAGAVTNGKADKEPEYYEVGLTPPVVLAMLLYIARLSLYILEL